MKYLRRFDENFILESVEDIYKELVNKWKQEQKKLGKNSNPGQGTRNRLMKQAKLQASENQQDVKKQTSVQSHSQTKCYKCESDLKPNSKFCTTCGTKVGTKDERATEKDLEDAKKRNLVDKEESSYTKKLKQFRNIISSPNFIKVYGNDSKESYEEILKDLDFIYKKDPERAERLLDIQLEMIQSFVDFSNKINK